MTGFIMFLIISSGSLYSAPRTITTVRFNTEQSCERASAIVKSKLQPNLYGTTIFTFCIPENP